MINTEGTILYLDDNDIKLSHKSKSLKELSLLSFACKDLIKKAHIAVYHGHRGTKMIKSAHVTCYPPQIGTPTCENEIIINSFCAKIKWGAKTKWIPLVVNIKTKIMGDNRLQVTSVHTSRNTHLSPCIMHHGDSLTIDVAKVDIKAE